MISIVYGSFSVGWGLSWSSRLASEENEANVSELMDPLESFFYFTEEFRGFKEGLWVMARAIEKDVN